MLTEVADGVWVRQNSLSAGLTGNISPHPGWLVQGTGSLL